MTGIGWLLNGSTDMRNMGRDHFSAQTSFLVSFYTADHLTAFQARWLERRMQYGPGNSLSAVAFFPNSVKRNLTSQNPVAGPNDQFIAKVMHFNNFRTL
jgi:hypothetical protein